MSRFFGAGMGLSAASAGRKARSRSTYRGRPQGYTLVELLVTVAVIGILGTMGFKVSSEGMRRAKVSAAGTQISFVLMRTRDLAVAEHQRYFVVVRSEADARIESLEIVRDDGSGVYEADQDTVIQTAMPKAGVLLGDGKGNTTDLAEIEEGVNALAFGARGEVRDAVTGNITTGTLNVTVPAMLQGGWLRYATINIAASGAVQQETHKEVAGTEEPG